MEIKMGLRPITILSIFLILISGVAAFGQSGSDLLITARSAGSIRLGMTVNEAKAAMPSAEFNSDLDTGKIKVDQPGSTIMSLTVETYNADGSEMPITSNSKIIIIEVLDPRYKTGDGAHVGMKLPDAEMLFGKLKEMVMSYGETESGEFTRQPPGISFEFQGSGDVSAGIYDGKYADPREKITTKYSRVARISLIRLALYG